MSKPLSEQVAELEAERDDIQRQLQEARDECDALRAGQGRWPRLGPATAPTVPRLITADELREGQTVAVYSDRSGVAAGVVYDLEPDLFRLDPGFHHSRTRYRPWMLSAICGGTIVLLEDAPQPTGYADDDHQDAEIDQWHAPGLTAESITTHTPPRLTVHKLNVAPVGSAIYGRNLRKGPDERWWCGPYNYSAEDLVEYGWADATLHPPGGPVMSTITFYMPQVADYLSANDRLHWAKKARLTKAWRDAGLVYARRERLPKLERAEIKVWVHKTTTRKYDAMNLYPSMKALVDGMTTDYGLLPDDDNDHLEGPFIYAGEKQSKPGLTITITPLNPRT